MIFLPKNNTFFFAAAQCHKEAVYKCGVCQLKIPDDHIQVKHISSSYTVCTFNQVHNMQITHIRCKLTMHIQVKHISYTRLTLTMHIQEKHIE